MKYYTTFHSDNFTSNDVMLIAVKDTNYRNNKCCIQYKTFASFLILLFTIIFSLLYEAIYFIMHGEGFEPSHLNDTGS